MSKPKTTSAKDQFVYSTLANDQKFNFFGSGANGSVPQVKKAIVINGKAGVAHRKTLVTLLGAVTRISADDYDQLKTHEQFKAFEKAGHLYVSDEKLDEEVAAADLNRDLSSPLTDEDFENLDGAKLAKTSGD